MNWKFTVLAVLVMVSVSAYAVVSECSDGSEAASDDSGSCEHYVRCVFDSSTGTLTISGSGSMDCFPSNTPWYQYRSDVKKVVIEDGITSISPNAFYGCSSLTSITIPDSVTSIGECTFYGCSSLTSITIPDSVTSIGECTFYGCSSLTSITIPDSVTSIGECTFYRCSSLTSVTIPDGVTSIGYYAFSGCSSLTSVTIPDSVTSIYSYTFSECFSLVSVTIPDSVTSIGSEAFSGCISLISIVVAEGNTVYRSVDGVLFSNDVKTLIQYPVGRSDDSYIIPDSVTSIGNWAFYGCSSLVSIVIGNGVNSIGKSAFYRCTGLRDLTIPISVNAVESNEHPVFSGCTNIEKVTFTPGTGKEYDYGVDSSSPSENYYVCTPWYYSRAVLKEVVIEDGVTSIGNWVFSGCSSLVSVTIPDSVTSIGFHAFRDCTGLREIIIPDSVTSIGSGAFFRCSSLTSIILPDSVTSIGWCAFYGCTDVSSIRIGPDVSSIGDRAFGDIVFYDKDAVSVLSTDANSLKGGCFVKTDDRMVKVDGHMMSFYVDGKVVYRGVFVEGDEDTHIPDVPFRPGYICSWEEFELGTEDISVNAVYTPGYYRVEFVSDGIVFFAYDLGYGMEITLPSGIPSKDADVRYVYTFSGWDGYIEDMTVDGDRVFNALFSRSVIVNAGEDGGYEVKADGEGAPFSSETISGIVDGASADPSVTLSVSVGDTLVSFDNEALRNLHGDDADLLVSRLSYGQMTQAVRDVVGDNVAYSISFGSNRNFGNGTVTVTIPYELAEGKDPDNLVVYYVAEDGTVEEIPCTYSEGYVTFSTDHFSVYAVMYEEPPSDGGPSDSMTVFAVIGIVIAIGAVGVGAMMFVKKKRV
ncbi:leucine-rich repeat domain-containing protein [Methanomethylophilus alvi]|uniref:leucine-rich repeat domain-containing protein n=1 Tax=Methanomethylophilus alvi TaxID=1291540 RepID=UPI0037DDACB2